MKKKNIPAEDLDFTDVFFKEVSEDVQNDNLKAFWKKYGVQIVAFVAVCLTLAVSFETIKHWRDVQNQKWSNAFAYAQILHTQGKTEDSLKALQQLQDDGNAIYSDLAVLKEINILFEQNKTSEALSKLETFIAQAHNDKFKNIALMKLASYRADQFSPEQMLDLLKPLLNNSSVWQAEAKEMVALTYLRDNDNAKALVLYQEILESHDINDLLRARAHNMISVLTNAGE